MAKGPTVGFLERYGAVLALLVVGTVALVVVLARGGVDPSQVGRAYLLSVGAIAIFGLVLELGRSAPFRGQGPSALSRAGAELPPDLASLQDSLRASRISRSQYELQVVPLFREIAADRLLLLGISLNRDPERAAEVLGPLLSSAIQAEGTPGGTRDQRGPRQQELEAIVAALEAGAR